MSTAPDIDLRMQKLGAMALQATSKEPLAVCAWDVECFSKPNMARAVIEDETKSSGVCAFQTSFRFTVYSGDGRRTVASVDVLCCERDDLWEGEFKKMEGWRLRMGQNHAAKVLNGLEKTGAGSYKDAMRRVRAESYEWIQKLHTISVEDLDTSIGCMLVVDPGKQYLSALIGMDMICERLEEKYKTEIFVFTSISSGKANDKLFPFASSIDPRAAALNLAGIGGKDGYSVLKNYCPILTARHVPLHLVFWNLYKNFRSEIGRAIQVLHPALASALMSFGKLKAEDLTLYDAKASSSDFGKHAKANADLEDLRRRHDKSELVDIFGKDAAKFNNMLHNARADVLEIDDVVAFFIILIRHVQEEAAAGAAPMEE